MTRRTALAVLAGGGVALATASLAVRRPATEPLPAAPIIDMHCHLAGLGYGGSGCLVSPAMRRNWRFGIYLRAFGVSHEELQRHGDGLLVQRLAQRVEASRHVQAAVLLALDGVIRDGRLDLQATEVYLPDAYLARETARHPNLHWGASVHPARRDAVDRLHWAKAHGAVLVKWLPNIQGIDPADPGWRPYYRTLAALGLPLLVHVGSEYSFARCDNRLGDPRRLRLALEEGVTVIAAHGGGGGCSDGRSNGDHLLAMLPDYPHLYSDISALTQINRRFRLAALLRDPVARERLLYGTDMPLPNTALVSPWYFLPELGPAKAWELQGAANPWDADVLLKQALGVPAAAFARPAQLLGLN